VSHQWLKVVDSSGKKHVLGMQEGATENVTVAKALLIHLREHGVDTEKKYLFVIDGAMALRAAIREVFGAGSAVQRCRTHKMRNVFRSDRRSSIFSTRFAACRQGFPC
jgi:putative transposase